MSQRVIFTTCCWHAAGHRLSELPYLRSSFLEYGSIKRRPSQHHSWHPISSLCPLLDAFFRCQASLTSCFPLICHHPAVLPPLQRVTGTVTPLAPWPSCQLCNRERLRCLPLWDPVRELAGPKEIAQAFLWSGWGEWVLIKLWPYREHPTLLHLFLSTIHKADARLLASLSRYKTGGPGSSKSGRLGLESQPLPLQSSCLKPAQNFFYHLNFTANPSQNWL